MTVKVNAQDTAGISKVEFYLDGVLKGTSTAAPFTKTISTAGLTNTNHTLLVRAYDMFGHTKDATRLITVDNVPPKITNVLLAPNPFFPIRRDGYKDYMWVKYRLSERCTVTWTLKNKAGTTVGTRAAVLQGPGPTSYKWNGRLYKPGTTQSRLLNEGTYRLTIRATDLAGNVTQSKAYAVKIQKYLVVILSNSKVKLVPH